MLSDLTVSVLKPNKACLIPCYFIINNEITTWGQFNHSFDQSDNMTLAMKTIGCAIWTLKCCLRPVGNWPCLFTPLPLCVSLYLFSLVDFSLFPALLLPVPDNFPQMAHQKRFIERKYRQELKEMRRERERQEKETDEPEECRKWQHLFFFFFWRSIRIRIHIKELWLQRWQPSRQELAKYRRH